MLGTALAYIALAFFIARISFAAAIAAGDAGLSGGGGDCCCLGGAGCCCAPAGTPARANPIARPAADKVLERRFIPNLLDCGVTAVQQREFPESLPEQPCRQGQ